MEDQWKATACILCSLNCGLEVQTDDRQIVKIKGDKRHPVSQGYLCEKAQRLNHYQNGADRLTSPMRRRDDGTYEAIDWDTAIREVAAKLMAVRDQHGGDKIVYYGGGGQGNHLCGSYGRSLANAVGIRYRSNALVQEKTGEFWVCSEMIGGYTHGDFENCEVAMFVGKNPWQSHGFARARAVIREIEKDPDRAMIVIDPRRSETAAKADYHLQLKPGTDAWCLAALVGILVQEDLVDREWMKKNTSGFDQIEQTLADIPVSEYAERCCVDENLLRTVARRIATSKSVATFEDLGLQMSVHSTLGSWLQRLVWMTTGNFGRQGTANLLVPLFEIAHFRPTDRRSPVAGARIISGLIPCNVIPEEILTDHPDRYRAMIVESGNPVHSLADSQRMREALRALEFSVVIDVAMTETAREADYVLPAASQFEKAEATFFNFEFPRNAFHIRKPLFDPLPGTLPEAEIHARLLEEMGELGERDYRPLRIAAKLGLTAFSAAFVTSVALKPKMMQYIGVILYRTLGPTLPKGMEAAAVVWGMCLQYVQRSPETAKRAGFGGPAPMAANKLFKQLIEGPSAVVFGESQYQDSFANIKTPDKRIQLFIPEMLEELKKIATEPLPNDTEYPFVLSAGERRSGTANTLIRDSSWHTKGEFAPLRISPSDADRLGCESGDRVRLSTERATAEVAVEVSDMMQPGHISLPNGVGLDYVDEDGNVIQKGIAPNELTDCNRRDFLAGTPWHKNVPARVEKVSAAVAASVEESFAS